MCSSSWYCCQVSRVQLVAAIICRLRDLRKVISITVNSMENRQLVFHASCYPWFFYYFLFHRGSEVRRWSFHVAWPPLNVVWIIGSKMRSYCLLRVFTPVLRAVHHSGQIAIPGLDNLYVHTEGAPATANALLINEKISPLTVMVPWPAGLWLFSIKGRVICLLETIWTQTMTLSQNNE